MRHFYRKCSLATTIGLATVACNHSVAPEVTPTRVGTVQPAIQARVLLVLTPTFERYTTESQAGIHHYVVHLGESGSKALQDMVGASFQHLEVQHVSEAALPQWLALPGDTGRADLVLVPNFTGSFARVRFFDFATDVALQLEVRCYRTGATYSWVGTGHATRAFGGWSGMTGSALELAVAALADTLSSNRGKLEVVAAR